MPYTSSIYKAGDSVYYNKEANSMAINYFRTTEISLNCDLFD